MLKPRGFTLIETMVALAVASVLLVAAVPGFKTWIQNVQIRRAAEAVLKGLPMARSEAVSRNTPVVFAMDANTGWTVGCVTVQDPQCPAVIQQRVSQQGTQPATASFTNMTAAGSLQFDGTGRISAGLQTAANSALFDITAPTGTCAADGGELKCLRVVASPFGQLRMCDPALTTTMPGDARAC